MVPIKYAPKPVIQESGGNGFAKILPLAGAAAGFVAGGAPGAALGMGLGGAAGGLLTKTPEIKPQDAGPAPVGGDGAMGRRLAEMNSSDPLMQIRKSLDALKTLPPEQRAEYAEPLLRAEYKARMG